MRIGVVTTSYPRRAGDHAGSFVAAHVHTLRDLGHDVEVIGAHTIASTLFDGHGAPDELERGRGHLRGAWFTARLTSAILRRARHWDLIIAHWLVPALAALPAGKPLLAIAHGGDVHTLRRLRLLAPAIAALRARGAKLAFASDELRAVASCPDALVQPMGIDLAQLARIARVPTTPPTILFVGRLVPIKGAGVLLEAAHHLHTPARIVIAGDGPLRAQLARDAPRNVTFAGAVDALTRDRLLGEASVVVVPSRVLANGRSEGTPMIALEALAAGVPVVASAVGGLASLTGATRVRPADPLALAAAIDRVLDSPPHPDELRRSVAGLDWPHVASRLLEHAGCASGDTNSRRSA